MYRLWHRLFGWDYVIWKNCADEGVARIRVDKSGRVYYLRYKGFSIVDPIDEAGRFIWLTCPPEKYLGATNE